MSVAPRGGFQLLLLLVSAWLASAQETRCGDAQFKGDFYCDAGNNNEACEWDGGDCCKETCEAANLLQQSQGNTVQPCHDDVYDCKDPDAGSGAGVSLQPTLVPTTVPSITTWAPTSGPIGVPSVAPSEATGIISGLMHEFCFAEACSTSDVIGGLQARLAGGATCSPGQGVALDGVSGYVDLRRTDESSGLRSGGTQFSIAVWGVIAQNGQAPRLADFSEDLDSTSQYVKFGLSGLTRFLEFAVAGAGVGGELPKVLRVNATGVPAADGALHLFTATREGPTFSLFIDETLLVQAVRPGEAGAAQRVRGINLLGRSSSSDASYLEGRISKFLYYNRALALEDVALLYRTGDASCLVTPTPTRTPTREPTLEPTDILSAAPSAVASAIPSGGPTEQPTILPSLHVPSGAPTEFPTGLASAEPTLLPSLGPVKGPTTSPSPFPSARPTLLPSTNPTLSDTAGPSVAPSSAPTDFTAGPSLMPSGPTAVPTAPPSIQPSETPSSSPSSPTTTPTGVPSLLPSQVVSTSPSSPTTIPTVFPSIVASVRPTVDPTQSFSPSSAPSVLASRAPTSQPTAFHSAAPSDVESSSPTTRPSRAPTEVPSDLGSGAPSLRSSVEPTELPNDSPSMTPSQGCGNGKEYSVADDTCYLCAAGRARNVSESASCEKCAAGSFAAEEGARNCTLCPAGRSTNGRSGASRCSICERSTVAQSGDTKCTRCPTGSFSSAGEAECSSCPAGFECADEVIVGPCAAGTYSDVQTNGSCVACPEGYFCTGGSDRVPCAPGKYQAIPGRRDCDSCRAGKFQDERGATGCKVCSAGYFCTPGSSEELKCGNPALYCGEGSSTPKPVTAGYYSLGRDELPSRRLQLDFWGPSAAPSGAPVEAVSIQPLSFSTSAPSLFPTFSADVANDGSLDPSFAPSLPPSSSRAPSLGPSSAPSLFPSASWQPTTRPSLSARPSFSSSNTPSLIPSSFFSFEPTPVFSPSPSFAPTAPPQPLDTAEREVICPRGHRCTGGVKMPCVAGTNYTAYPGATDCSLCTVCKAGEFVTRACTPSRDQLCDVCDPGKFSNTTNAPECSPCPAGYFCPSFSTSGLKCGSASLFCPEGSSLPQPVEKGFYSSPLAVSEELRSEELPCEKGYQCVAGIRSACSPTTFAADSQATACANCASCAKGSFVSTNCTSTSDTVCTSCPGGTFSEELNSQSCKECPVGSFCPPASPLALPCGSLSLFCGGGLASPNNVLQGYFSTPERGNNATRTGQQRCPIGYSCSGGLKTRCVSGETLATEDGAQGCRPCFACNPGSRILEACRPDAETICEPCSPGRYQNATGQSTCLPVPKGTYSGVGESSPQKCEPGTFTDAAGQAECGTCPENTYADEVGIGLCKDCPPHSTTLGLDGRFCVADCVCAFGPNVKITGLNLAQDTGDENTTAEAPLECSCSANEYIDTEALKRGDYDEVCQTCSEGLVCGAFGTKLRSLDLMPGYWRSGPLSGDVRECIAEEACVGGRDAASYCAEGHDPESPYCGACTPGYFLDVVDVCRECSRGQVSRTGAIIAGVLALVLLVGAAGAFKRSISDHDVWLYVKAEVVRYSRRHDAYIVRYSEKPSWSRRIFAWLRGDLAEAREVTVRVTPDKIRMEAFGEVLGDLGHDEERGGRVYELMIKLENERVVSPALQRTPTRPCARRKVAVEHLSAVSTALATNRLTQIGRRTGARLVKVHHDQILRSIAGARMLRGPWGLKLWRTTPTMERLGLVEHVEVLDGPYEVGDEVVFLLWLDQDGYDPRQENRGRASGDVLVRLHPRALFLPIYVLLKPKEVIEELEVKIRVVLGFFQIYGIMKSSVQLPVGFLKFMRHFQILEFDLFRTLGIQCLIWHEFKVAADFFDVLLLSTLGPIFIVGLLYCLYLCIDRLKWWEHLERRRLGLRVRDGDDLSTLPSQEQESPLDPMDDMEKPGGRFASENEKSNRMKGNAFAPMSRRDMFPQRRDRWQVCRDLYGRAMAVLIGFLPKKRATYGYIILLVLFLVLPAATTNTLFTFLCDKIDTGDSFLIVDYSIQCFTPRHNFYMVYAGCMVGVFPIGVPLLYAHLLFKNRDVLRLDFGLRMLDKRAQRLAFLWDAYQPSFWYFELIDSIRRLALTALPVVLRFIGNGGEASVSETAATLVVANCFLAVYCFWRPFEEPSDNHLMILSQLGIVLLLIVSLVELNGDMSASDERSWNIILIAIILGILLMLVVSIFYFKASLKEVVERIYAFAHDQVDAPPVKTEKVSAKAQEMSQRMRSQGTTISLLLAQSPDTLVAGVCEKLAAGRRRPTSPRLPPEELLAAFKIQPRRVMNALFELTDFSLGRGATPTDFEWFRENLLRDDVFVWFEEDMDSKERSRSRRFELRQVCASPHSPPPPPPPLPTQLLYHRLCGMASTNRRLIEFEFKDEVEELRRKDSRSWRRLAKVPKARSYLNSQGDANAGLVQEVRQDADGVGLQSPVEGGRGDVSPASPGRGEFTMQRSRQWSQRFTGALGRSPRARDEDLETEGSRAADSDSDDDGHGDSWSAEQNTELLLYLGMLRKYALSSQDLFHTRMERIFADPLDPIFMPMTWEHHRTGSGLGLEGDNDAECERSTRPIQCWLNPVEYDFDETKELEDDEIVLPRAPSITAFTGRSRSRHGRSRSRMRSEGHKNYVRSRSADVEYDAWGDDVLQYISKRPDIPALDELEDRALHRGGGDHTPITAKLLNILRSTVVFETLGDLCAGYEHFLHRIDKDPFLSLASIHNTHLPLQARYMNVTIHFLFVPDEREGGDPRHRQICEVELVLLKVYEWKRGLHARQMFVLQKSLFFEQTTQALALLDELEEERRADEQLARDEAKFLSDSETELLFPGRSGRPSPVQSRLRRSPLRPVSPEESSADEHARLAHLFGSRSPRHSRPPRPPRGEVKEGLPPLPPSSSRRNPLLGAAELEAPPRTASRSSSAEAADLSIGEPPRNIFFGKHPLPLDGTPGATLSRDDWLEAGRSLTPRSGEKHIHNQNGGRLLYFNQRKRRRSAPASTPYEMPEPPQTEPPPAPSLGQSPAGQGALGSSGASLCAPSLHEEAASPPFRPGLDNQSSLRGEADLRDRRRLYAQRFQGNGQAMRKGSPRVPRRHSVPDRGRRSRSWRDMDSESDDAATGSNEASPEPRWPRRRGKTEEDESPPQHAPPAQDADEGTVSIVSLFQSKRRASAYARDELGRESKDHVEDIQDSDASPGEDFSDQRWERLFPPELLRPPSGTGD